MNEPTVFIIDDDPSARSGLTRLVQAAGLPVKAFASAVEFLDSGQTHNPGCIVLDVRMPAMSGIELQKKLNKQPNHLPIIFISAHGDIPMATHTLKQGAVDFLTKPVDAESLLAAIELALKNNKIHRKQHAERAAVRTQIDALTPREYEIMTYVITGQLNKQVAGELNISEDTVKTHRGRVMRKLNVESAVELVRLCEHAGIAPADC